jgi:multidrug efflux pump subunit AcrA (membrane-fusion protein)
MEKSRIDEARSEEVQDILSYMPGWIVRWGITAFFFAIIVLLFVGWFVKYPEIVPGRVTVTTDMPPARLVTRAAGRVTFFVKENDAVKKEQYLAVIENSASIADVMLLKEQLARFETVLQNPGPADISTFPFNEALNLGELQPHFLALTRACKDYKLLNTLDYRKKQIASLNAQVSYYEKLNAKFENQRKLMERELELTEKQYNNDKKLFDQKVIPQVELDRSESAFLQKRYALENAQTSIINNSIQISVLQKQILDISLQDQEAGTQSVLVVEESFKRMQGQLAVWEQQYVLKAPVEGRVSFSRVWSSSQFVNAGEEVMSVVPVSQQLFAMVQMHAYGSGKVKEGQRVKIKLDSYPFHEYGIVYGEVLNISQVPRDNMYFIKVKLPKGLHTSYNKTLDFREEMQGNAEIITKDLRLLQRIFNRFRGIFSDSLDE